MGALRRNLGAAPGGDDFHFAREHRERGLRDLAGVVPRIGADTERARQRHHPRQRTAQRAFGQLDADPVRNGADPVRSRRLHDPALARAHREVAHRLRGCVAEQAEQHLFASELVIRAGRMQLDVREIPLTLREIRPPSIRLAKRVPRVLKNLGKLVWVIRVRDKLWQRSP